MNNKGIIKSTAHIHHRISRIRVSHIWLSILGLIERRMNATRISGLIKWRMSTSSKINSWLRSPLRNYDWLLMNDLVGSWHSMNKHLLVLILNLWIRLRLGIKLRLNLVLVNSYSLMALLEIHNLRRSCHLVLYLSLHVYMLSLYLFNIPLFFAPGIILHLKTINHALFLVNIYFFYIFFYIFIIFILSLNLALFLREFFFFRF